MSREPKAPIWARPEPRGRGPRAQLSRAEIVRTAARIADEEGLEAVSIRRLAKDLGAGAMSLYHYFDSRDELLELMADAVAAELLVPDLPANWREALTEIARHSRATFLRHPWMLATLQERPQVSPNLLRHVEQSAQSVAGLAGMAPPEFLGAIVTAVDDYTVGYTFRELAAGAPGERGRHLAARFADAAEDPNIRYLLESGEFPMLSQFASAGGQVPVQDFELGLDWLLDGFAAQIG
jgi:AcrR family transcriptional regulator